MTTQFEFRLIGASAPDGELEAEQLLAIVTSLKEIATKIGRVETDAEPVGRAPKRTQRVAKLTIGLAPGSTSVLARRTGAGGALDFDLVDEQSFDEKFAALVESIALDQRPSWVGDSLSLAAADLTAALQQAAPEVEFKVAGEMRRRFKTEQTHRETWRVDPTSSSDSITFAGRLYAVNLNTHRLQVQDDVGHQVALPKVSNDAEVSWLIGSYVAVTGAPERDTRGRLTHIHDAAVVAAPDPLGGDVVPAAVSLDEILASAPGIEPGGIEGLTDSEFDSFFAAMGL
jgi:hypothetical protein